MEYKEKNFVSSIIYVHNAENRIGFFLTAILEFMEKNFEHSEIICVNDYSQDKSLNEIKMVSEQAASASISIVNMSYFHGLELSMNAGQDLSIGDFVFEFDNTVLDFEPSVIMDVYRKSLQGYDIVSASANRKERFTSRLFYRVFYRYSYLASKMETESFRVLSRRVLNRIQSMNKTIPYRKAVYANCGLKTTTIKYQPTEISLHREDPDEKSYRSALAMDSLILFTGVGYRFARAMTVFMMLISVFMTLYSIVIYSTANPVAGWTTTILFLSIAFCGLFGILTIVIKYLQLIVDLVFKRKQYTFESIEKISK